MAGASGKKLDEIYKLAWIRGLKTTYYLRTMGATHAEKSTAKAGQLNAVPPLGEHLERRNCPTPEDPKFVRDRQPRVRGMPVVITAGRRQFAGSVHSRRLWSPPARPRRLYAVDGAGLAA